MTVIDLLPEERRIQLLRGDDYLASHGRAINFTRGARFWPDLMDAAVEMAMAYRGIDLFRVTGTILETTGESATVQFELGNAETFNLPIGALSFDAQATLADGRVYTLVRGFADVERDFALSPSQVLPAVPSNVQALGANATEIELSWSANSTNEYGFIVERLAPEHGWQVVGRTEAQVVTFTDHQLEPNTYYWYRVRAFNAMGYSAYAASTHGQTLAA